MEARTQTQQEHEDIYPGRLLDGRIYKEVTERTIETAFKSYKTTRCLSIISFIVGVVLLVCAIIFAFYQNDTIWLSVAFGAFGTANIVILLVTRPVERIQSGVDELIKSQIACLNFAASYESTARYLIAASELPFDDKNRDIKEEFERAKYLMDAAFQFVNTRQPTITNNAT